MGKGQLDEVTAADKLEQFRQYAHVHMYVGLGLLMGLPTLSYLGVESSIRQYFC